MTRRIFCLMLLSALASRPAGAASSFRVAGEPRVVERGTPAEAVIVPIAWQHAGAADKVHFFLHATTPTHDTNRVKAGKPVGMIEFAAASGQAEITVPRQSIAELKLQPGGSAALTFWMERIGHRWGTASGSRSQGTTFAVPNSSLHRLGARRLVPFGIRLAPAAPRRLLPLVRSRFIRGARAR